MVAKYLCGGGHCRGDFRWIPAHLLRLPWWLYPLHSGGTRTPRCIWKHLVKFRHNLCIRQSFFLILLRLFPQWKSTFARMASKNPDPDPDPGFWWQKKKNYVCDKPGRYYIRLRHPRAISKLQEKPPPPPERKFNSILPLRIQIQNCNHCGKSKNPQVARPRIEPRPCRTLRQVGLLTIHPSYTLNLATKRST